MAKDCAGKSFELGIDGKSGSVPTLSPGGGNE